MRHALLALLLLAGCPGARTTPPAEPAVPPEPTGTAPDEDEDGVADNLDPCPREPGSDNGCPSVKTGDDRDGDGVKNNLDKCPDDPEDKDAFQDDDGCPDPDNDGDGVSDANDLCPNDAEDKDAFEDSDGCPDPDNDKDMILDRNDKCPDKPEDFDGDSDQDGCPEAGALSNVPPPVYIDKPKPKPKPKGPADRDKDGITDDKDRCPDEPETVNGKKDGDGCPD